MATTTKPKPSIVYILNVSDPADVRIRRRFRFTSKAARETAKRSAEKHGFETSSADVMRTERVR